MNQNHNCRWLGEQGIEFLVQVVGAYCIVLKDKMILRSRVVRYPLSPQNFTRISLNNTLDRLSISLNATTHQATKPLALPLNFASVSQTSGTKALVKYAITPHAATMEGYAPSNDGGMANWDVYESSPRGAVYTSWDELGQPHEATYFYGGSSPQSTATDRWAYTTAAPTATATESWMSQATSDASVSQSWSWSETATETDARETSTGTSTDSYATTSPTSTDTTATTSKPSKVSSGTFLPTTDASVSTSSPIPDSNSPFSLSTKTQVAIAIPIAIAGTIFLLALLFLIRRRGRNQPPAPRSRPYLNMKGPWGSKLRLPLHSHSDSQGDANNWGSMSRDMIFPGSASRMETGRASPRHIDIYDAVAAQKQQSQNTSIHRPSFSVSGAGLTLLPDPLHSHPNTPTSDELAGNGLAPSITTTQERGPSNDPGFLPEYRPQSPFDHPLDDAVSAISGISGQRVTMFGELGLGHRHYRGVGDDESSVSSLSDDEESRRRSGRN